MELSEQQEEQPVDSGVKEVLEQSQPQVSEGTNEVSKVEPAPVNSVEPASRAEPVEEGKKPSEDRISMLSDGIFAIAVTLLVLNIQIPLPENSKDGRAFVNILGGSFFSETRYYLITFAVLASYWFNHRTLMDNIKRINPTFIWLNLLFLAFVAFFPVATNLLRYTQFPEAVIIYTAVLAGCGYSSFLLWLYAFRGGLLSTDAIGTTIKVGGILGAANSPNFFLLSLLLLLLPPFQPGYISSSWLYLPPCSPADIFYSWLLLPIAAIVARLLGFSGGAYRAGTGRNKKQKSSDQSSKRHT